MLLTLHNLLGIKIVNCSNRFAKYINNELFFLKNANSEKIDIELKFVDSLSLKGDTYYISTKAGYNNDFFYVTDHYGSKATIPFDELGKQSQIQIICESSFDPLLLYNIIIEPIIHCCLLLKNAVMIHSSSFVHKGKGFLLMAWAHTGKTNVLLCSLINGSKYSSDDWTIVTGDGRMWPYPRRLSLFDYNFAEFPQLRKQLSIGQKIRLGLKTAYEKIYTLCPMGDSLSLRVFRRIKDLSVMFANARVPVTQLFPYAIGTNACHLINRAFILSKTNSSTIQVECTDSTALANKMAACITYERMGFLEYYQMYKFGHPSNICPLLENLQPITSKVLVSTFQDVEIYFVKIPERAKASEIYNIICENK